MFDFWVHTPDRMNQITAMDENKIGWIGTSSNGEKRALTKFTWNNPHPEKNISNIDFIGGLSNCAPFIVGITLE